MRTLPDVTSDIYTKTPSTLRWVGMEEIAVPVSMKLQNATLQQVVAKANIFVSLDEPNSKGIHMSRAHLVVNRLAELECNKSTINALLTDMIDSQGCISQQARIELRFDLLLHKPALLSDKKGFQSYPVVVRAEKNTDGFDYEFELTIPYSSTCPCSASLARQLYADAIDNTFSDSTINKAELLAWVQSQAGSVATPHSQRSYAYVRLSIGDADWMDLSQLMFQLESVIGTPVQTAVKRIDEQEFARLNATNLMFCEDAARRIKQFLEPMQTVKDYWFKVEHQESLHAHNAVVIDQKYNGVPQG